MIPVIFVTLCGVSVFLLLFAIGLSAMRPRAGPGGEDRRVLRRCPIRSSFEVCWRDPGRALRRARMRGRDISERGAGLKSFIPMRRDSVIYVSAPQLGIDGRARVRHCFRRGLRHVIGVEFQ